jgi:hypothetical protein
MPRTQQFARQSQRRQRPGTRARRGKVYGNDYAYCPGTHWRISSTTSRSFRALLRGLRSRDFTDVMTGAGTSVRRPGLHQARQPQRKPLAVGNDSRQRHSRSKPNSTELATNVRTERIELMKMMTRCIQRTFSASPSVALPAADRRGSTVSRLTCRAPCSPSTIRATFHQFLPDQRFPIAGHRHRRRAGPPEAFYVRQTCSLAVSSTLATSAGCDPCPSRRASESETGVHLFDAHKQTTARS